MPVLHTLLLSTFTCLLLWAAYSDVRRFEIPNAVPLALLGLYPLFAFVSPGLVHPLITILVAAASFIVGAGLFAAGLMGGGDVKLFAAASLWIGPARCIDFLTLTALAGGVFALILLTGRVLLTERGRTLLARVSTQPPSPSGPLPSFRRPMPYGVAITAAAIAIVLPPNFS
jgi:prepilin peptidase CpaA